jgi:hypothetical protein
MSVDGARDILTVGDTDGTLVGLVDERVAASSRGIGAVLADE